MHFTTITKSIFTLALAFSAVMANPVAVPAAEEGDAAAMEAREVEVLEDRGVLEARIAPCLDLWPSNSYLPAASVYTSSCNPAACVNLPSARADWAASGKAKTGKQCRVWNTWNCNDAAPAPPPTPHAWPTTSFFINAPVFPTTHWKLVKSYKCWY